MQNRRPLSALLIHSFTARPADFTVSPRPCAVRCFLHLRFYPTVVPSLRQQLTSLFRFSIFFLDPIYRTSRPLLDLPASWTVFCLPLSLFYLSSSLLVTLTLTFTIAQLLPASSGPAGLRSSISTQAIVQRTVNKRSVHCADRPLSTRLDIVPSHCYAFSVTTLFILSHLIHSILDLLQFSFVYQDKSYQQLAFKLSYH